jgi:hypothetical protein
VGTQISEWRSGARRFLSRNGQLHCADYYRPAQLEEALKLRLGAKVRGVLRNARAFTEGRLLFILVESEQDCRDVEHLLRVRTSPLKKPRVQCSRVAAPLRRVVYVSVIAFSSPSREAPRGRPFSGLG